MFTLEMGEPLVPLGVFGELVVTVTESPLVPSEISTVLVTVVIGGSLVPSEVSRELLVIMTEGPMVPVEVSKGSAFVMTLVASRDPVAMVTVDSLVPLDTSRDPVALIPPVTVRRPEADIARTVELLILVEISWIVDFMVGGSWEIVDSDTGGPSMLAVEISGEDTSLVV